MLGRNSNAEANTMEKVSMMRRLSGKWRLWGEALAGMHDPLGEYLLKLEERVGRLEGEMELLRKPPSANAVTAASMSVQGPPAEGGAYPRAKDFE